jgi:hypothetical protein
MFFHIAVRLYIARARPCQENPCGFSTRALSPAILCGVPFRVHAGKMKTMAVDEILTLLA